MTRRWPSVPASPARFTVSELLDALENAQSHLVVKPWGYEAVIDVPDLDVTLKYIVVRGGKRTSLQHHVEKDEVIFVLNGDGTVLGTDDERRPCPRPTQGLRVRPGVVHRSEGHLELLEVSTYQPDDVVRHSDDYGR
jgi:mannose-6-phosphate isomerase-like protein (cupin superfamily)